MKPEINKLIELADALDGLGLKKYADKLDQLISKFAGEDEEMKDLADLFDEPLAPDEEEGVPVATRLTQIPEEEEVFTPIADEPVSSRDLHGLDRPNRLDALKRRHQIMQLQKSLEQDEAEEAEPLETEEDKIEQQLQDLADKGVGSDTEEALDLSPMEDDEDFEDEDLEDNADDGLIDALKEKLKEVPELGAKLLTLVKDNPELLELLAL